MKDWIVLGSCLMGLAVAIGAFGAHGLKSKVSNEDLIIFEPGVRYQIYHSLALIILGLIAWFIGLGTVFSDNIWAEYKFYGMNFFEVIAVLTDQFMLPLGGLLICILVGFCVPKLDFIKEIDLSNNLSNVFNVCLKFVAPVSVLLIFGYALS